MSTGQFHLKKCPRCTGDLYFDKDQFGPFVTCLQCGYSRDLIVTTQSETTPRSRRSSGGRHLNAKDGDKD
jgi:predicted nucleic-acid-binding Zn-ribbon protein